MRIRELRGEDTFSLNSDGSKMNLVHTGHRDIDADVDDVGIEEIMSDKKTPTTPKPNGPTVLEW